MFQFCIVLVVHLCRRPIWPRRTGVVVVAVVVVVVVSAVNPCLEAVKSRSQMSSRFAESIIFVSNVDTNGVKTPTHLKRLVDGTPETSTTTNFKKLFFNVQFLFALNAGVRTFITPVSSHDIFKIQHVPWYTH